MNWYLYTEGGGFLHRPGRNGWGIPTGLKVKIHKVMTSGDRKMVRFRINNPSSSTHGDEVTEDMSELHMDFVLAVPVDEVPSKWASKWAAIIQE